MPTKGAYEVALMLHKKQGTARVPFLGDFYRDQRDSRFSRIFFFFTSRSRSRAVSISLSLLEKE